MIRKYILFTGCLIFSMYTFAQRIVYSEPEHDDNRKIDFEIAGKISDHYLIYKNQRSSYHICVYDNSFKQINKTNLDFIPGNDRLINVDFINYPSYVYMVYQYQKKNIVYCMGAKIDGDGKLISGPFTIDTSHFGYTANNKIYSLLVSENKNKIMIYKINNKNRRYFNITTILLNQNLDSLHKSIFSMPMEEERNHLNEFTINNDGDLAFTKFYNSAYDDINAASFIFKNAYSDSLKEMSLNIQHHSLDEIHIKADNFNNRFILASFYFKKKRNTVDGIFTYVWDNAKQLNIVQDTIVFSDALRNEAKGDAGLQGAFNDYFIRNIIPLGNGGFIIGSECYYTTTRMGGMGNRYDNLYTNSISGYNGYYIPYSSNPWYYQRNFNNQTLRYHSENIVTFSINPLGKLSWATVIPHDEFDDQTDENLSYVIMNTSNQLHYLTNNVEKHAILLNDYILTPNGDLTHSPTLKNLDRGYILLPKFAKQVASNIIIIPCTYRNYICFAKLDFN